MAQPEDLCDPTVVPHSLSYVCRSLPRDSDHAQPVHPALTSQRPTEASQR